MGKMSYISHLCENNKKDELMEEVGFLAKLTGSTASLVADEFLEAHRNMRNNKENPSFTKLNEIHDEMQEKYEEDE
tara:strand:- start:554 stop:781 length:228 start_codon:yes stop_codon:yes gene_type:complete